MRGCRVARSSIVLVDGRSGAGKTDYARSLAETTGAQLVSIDEVYPGWDGLDAGSAHIYRYLLTPLLAGMPGSYQRWDWAHGTHGEWRTIAAGTDVVIEGCGAIRRGAPGQVTETIWLECPEETRQQRAMDRDGALYRPHWERWARQEDRFLRIHESDETADRRVWGE